VQDLGNDKAGCSAALWKDFGAHPGRGLSHWASLLPKGLETQESTSILRPPYREHHQHWPSSALMLWNPLPALRAPVVPQTKMLPVLGCREPLGSKMRPHQGIAYQEIDPCRNRESCKQSRALLPATLKLEG